MTYQTTRGGLYVFVIGLIAVALALLLLQSTETVVALLIIGLAMIGLFVEPFVGLIVCVLFLFLKPAEYVPGLQGTNVFLMMIGATFASMIVRDALEKRSIQLFRAPQDYVLLWLLVAVVLSRLVHLDFSGAAYAGTDFLRNVVLYFAITNMLTSARRIRVFIVATALATVMLAFMGVYQAVTGVGLTGMTMLKGRVVAVGSATDPNIYAQTILIGIPFLLYVVLSNQRMWMRFLSLLFVCVIVYVLYLTNSRGGTLATALILGTIVLRAKGLRWGLPATAVALGGAWIWGPSRMQTIGIDAPRIPLWGHGLELFRAHPIFGIGKGAWGEYTDSMVAHNSFVQCAAEVGIFGLLPWILLLYLSISHLGFVSREEQQGVNGGGYRSSDATMVSILGFLYAAVFLSRPFSWLLFILIALAAAIANNHTKRSAHEYRLLEMKDFVVAAALSAGGLLVLHVFVSAAMMVQSP